MQLCVRPGAEAGAAPTGSGEGVGAEGAEPGGTALWYHPQPCRVGYPPKAGAPHFRMAPRTSPHSHMTQNARGAQKGKTRGGAGRILTANEHAGCDKRTAAGTHLAPAAAASSSAAKATNATRAAMWRLLRGGAPGLTRRMCHKCPQTAEGRLVGGSGVDPAAAYWQPGFAKWGGDECLSRLNGAL